MKSPPLCTWACNGPTRHYFKSSLHWSTMSPQHDLFRPMKPTTSDLLKTDWFHKIHYNLRSCLSQEVYNAMTLQGCALMFTVAMKTCHNILVLELNMRWTNTWLSEHLPSGGGVISPYDITKGQLSNYQNFLRGGARGDLRGDGPPMTHFIVWKSSLKKVYSKYYIHFYSLFFLQCCNLFFIWWFLNISVCKIHACRLKQYDNKTVF